MENDFEVIQARTASCSGPNNFLVETDHTSFATSWDYGSSWAPEDNLDFSLDPNGQWYDEALEADIANTTVDTAAPTKRKIKRTQISVRLHVSHSHLCSHLCNIFVRPGHMFIGKHMHETFISMKCFDEKVAEIFVEILHVQTVSQEGRKTLRRRSSGVKTAFYQI